MNLIQIDDIDTTNPKFIYKHKFASLKTCKIICEFKKVNVFIIDKKDMVYYKKQSIVDTVFNLKRTNGIKLYIYSKNIQFLSEEERLDRYITGIKKKLPKSKLSNNYQYLLDFIANEDNKKRHVYKSFNRFIDLLKDRRFDFNFNPFDLSYSKIEPTFTKSRLLLNPQRSVLLPLEPLYIPNFYIDIFKDDTPFENKLKSVVWRGANSGCYYYKTSNKASRKDLVRKYYKHKVYNIGLSYANYKSDSNIINQEEQKFVKGKLSLEEQLKYLFILSVEGNDFATNLSWVMLSNSVPVMPKPLIETWKLEGNLEPYKHYLPVELDFSDLEEKINWGINNMDKCKEIVYQSKLYALQFFNKEKEQRLIDSVIDCYQANVHK